MYHLLCATGLVIASLFSRGFKRIHDYLPTMYYISMMNLFYLFIAHSLKKLWVLEKPFISHFINNTLYTFITLPAISLLFLHHYPDHKDKTQQLYYIGKWVAGSIIIEWFAYKWGYIKFYEGYSFLWEFFFYPTMYIMLRLHYVKPFLAILTSIPIICSLLIIFEYNVK
ncbi:CBO0543 family protein [Bacillus salitolerans]|uniref:CBO0543 family protein n=1 Tax=Bacillus salitolerans TaxID=1437434 RepID=A0ABW4LSY5_9BACI